MTVGARPVERRNADFVWRRSRIPETGGTEANGTGGQRDGLGAAETEHLKRVPKT
jgi:hypothetical protein